MFVVTNRNLRGDARFNTNGFRHTYNPLFGCFKEQPMVAVRVTHILLLTGVFKGHECRSNRSIFGAWGTFKFFLKKIFDVVIRSNMAAIFFFCATWGPVWWRSRNGSVTLTYCHMSRWCLIVFYFWHHKQWGCFDHFLLCYQWFWHWANWHLKWDCEQGIYVGWK